VVTSASAMNESSGTKGTTSPLLKGYHVARKSCTQTTICLLSDVAEKYHQTNPPLTQGEVRVLNVNVTKGTFEVSGGGSKKVTVTIPWNHIGDNLVRLWKKVDPHSTRYHLVMDLASGGSLAPYVNPRIERKK